MAIVKDNAFVLNKKDLRETSIFATFFTREFGKIKGELKGIRADSKKFGSKLEAGSLNEIVFYQKKSLVHLIDQCDLKENFESIRKNSSLMAMAFYFIELTNLIVPFEEKNEAVFDLLKDSLTTLSLEQSLDSLYIFQIKLLKLSGFKPHIDSCIACNNNIGPEKAFFSLQMGGLLCDKCLIKDRNAKEILKGTVASLRHLEKSSWQESLRLKLLPKIKLELKEVLFNFFDFHLEERPNSVRFMALN